MNISLRSRWIAVSILALIACAASLLSVLQLARSNSEQRPERAREFVEREVERARDDAERVRGRPGARFGRGMTGYLDAGFNPVSGPPGLPQLWAFRLDVARESARARTTVVRTLEQRMPGGFRRRAPDGETEGTLVLGVGPGRDGGYAWAATWVAQPRGERMWRFGATTLSLATLALVVVAMHTLLTLRRGAGQLGETLHALAKDLRAPVTRPPVAELAAVSDGIASLAQALLRAQDGAGAPRARARTARAPRPLGRVAAGIAHEVRNPMASISCASTSRAARRCSCGPTSRGRRGGPRGGRRRGLGLRSSRGRSAGDLGHAWVRGAGEVDPCARSSTSARGLQ
ncbi:MAG: hypothetical protein U0326_24700 [Polyangiales bacterium]